MLAEINPEELSVASSQVDGQFSDSANETMVENLNTAAIDVEDENILNP